MSISADSEPAETPELQTDSASVQTPSQSDRLDSIFSTLQNSRRRLIIRYLEDETEATIGELAEYVAAVENDIPVREVRSGDRKTVYVSLYQTHLPKLDRVGAVTYDKDRGTVEMTAAMTDFVTVLDRFESQEPNQTFNPSRYRAVSLFLVVSLLAAGLASLSSRTPSVAPSDITGVGVILLSVAMALVGCFFLRRAVKT